MDSKLKELREKIRVVDEEILRLICRRFELAKQVNQVKRKFNIPVIDYAVEREVIDHAIKISRQQGLRPEFTSNIVQLLLAESVRVQNPQQMKHNQAVNKILNEAGVLESRGKTVLRLDLDHSVSFPEPVRDPSSVAYSGQPQSSHMELQEALAECVNSQFGLNVQPKDIVASSNGQALVFAVMLSLSLACDRLLIPLPVSPTHIQAAQTAQKRVDNIVTSLEEGWKLNLTEVEAALGAGGRLVVLASPAHPTGRIIPADELRDIARITRKHKASVMCDERAAHLAVKDLPSALEFLEDRFVCIRTIQNTGGKGQPPFRITYAVNVGVKDEQVRSMFAIAGLNPPALPPTAKIIDAFKESSNLAFASEVAQRIDVACSKLDTMRASYYKPEGGLWMFPRINIQGFRATEFVRELLRERMIAVSPGDAFGPYPDHIGLSLAPSPSTLIQGLEKIKEALTVA